MQNHSGIGVRVNQTHGNVQQTTRVLSAKSEGKPGTAHVRYRAVQAENGARNGKPKKGARHVSNPRKNQKQRGTHPIKRVTQCHERMRASSYGVKRVRCPAKTRKGKQPIYTRKNAAVPRGG